VIITAQEWKIYHQIEITLKMMGFWQCVLEGEKYITGSFVPVAIYAIITEQKKGGIKLN
jgi:hypothetical protein